MEKHDEHYSEMTIQPMGVMEERIYTDEHRTNGPTRLQCFNLALALKYIMRAGKKEGQPWVKDIEKAQNHLHRALTGKWLPGPAPSG